MKTHSSTRRKRRTRPDNWDEEKAAALRALQESLDRHQ
ncbi:hypothetical protein J2S69_003891 [Glycomyces lechevalierae]|uniref:Uncharacterized protein n=1 Tax=Glycomyces lechevalierae TaxID=256034 RepID=A0ABU2ASJ1_9ACTN|nr:hypothetical protein [Glycomyces lechevalierae]